ncbi:hypothetical protein ANRL3_02569 [Anaerolineae bacterium]|nr:hypothetical protein ANRL3_02569 [Anaerolineae bacterium]
MPKKPVTKKKVVAKAKPRKATPSRIVKVGTMKGGIIADKIIAKRGNIIMGNQYNDYRKQIAQVATPQQFIAEAEKLQTQIAEVKQLPALPASQQRRIEAIEGDVKEVIVEAKKDKPNPKTMRDTLKTAAETMEGVGKTLDAAQGVGKKIDDVIIKGMDWGRIALGLGGLANVAIKLFGG